MLADELRLLEGLAASIWLVLEAGPRDVASIVSALGQWELEARESEVAEMVDVLSSSGVLDS